MADNGDGGTIVELDREHGTGDRGTADRLEAAWEAMRAGGLLPYAGDVNPARLDVDLSRVFLLDRIAPGLARVAVAGRHLTDIMGTDAEGMPFAALMRPDARDGLRDAMRAVFEEPAVVRMRLTSPGGFARPRLRADLILLPLAGDRFSVTRVLGALDAGPRLGRVPRRFGIEDQERRGLVGYALPRAKRLVPGMAERGAPYLRLVKG